VGHGIAAFERARELNPNYPHAHAEIGRAKIDAGLGHESVTHIAQAVRLSPTDPAQYIWSYWAGMAAAHVGDYKTAVEWLLRSRQSNRAYTNSIPWLAVAYAGSGKTEQAQVLMDDYRSTRPLFSVARWNSLLPHLTPELAQQRRRVAQILRDLNVPEGPVQTGSVK
jgi:tetratricopeptide (TPR) repeat protein